MKKKEKNIKHCRECNNNFNITNDRKFFCSKKCHQQWLRKNIQEGENHPNWKGGYEEFYKRYLEKTKKNNYFKTR